MSYSNAGRKTKGRTNNTVNSRIARGRQVDKTVAVTPEGVYTNPRFTHVATTLVGSFVQVQVKNGKIYEGVFKTFSSKVEMVLELAHLIEEPSTQNSTELHKVPSRERLIEKLIVNVQDIVVMSATGVDLTYAHKDNFTDTAISKCNGATEKDFKELEPWQGDDEDDHITLDGGTSHGGGWDANDMFHENAQKFNVKSTYDESLELYTTPLETKNTKEYRQRELEAARLAQEIENCDIHHKRADLENGDDDEEAKYSAVMRPGEAVNMGSSDGKYVPPHMRSSNPRGGGVGRGGGRGTGRMSPQGTPPRLQQDHSKPSQASPHPPTIEENGLNGEKLSERKQEQNALENSTSTKPVKEEKSSSQTAAKINPKDPVISGLLEFKSQFKLHDQNGDSEKLSQPASPKQRKLSDSVSPQQQTSPKPVQTQISPKTQSSPAQQTVQQSGQPTTSVQEKAESEKNTESVLKISSTLNPNAAEFKLNPNAKTFQPRTNSTPPQTHRVPSPGMVPVAYSPMQPYQPSPQYIVMPQQQPTQMVQPQMVPQQPHVQRPPKKATVSVQQRQEYTSSQAAAATGPPIQIQPQQPTSYVQYNPNMQGMQQQMSYPSNAQFRMMVPNGQTVILPPSPGVSNDQGNAPTQATPVMMQGHHGGNPNMQPMPVHGQFPGPGMHNAHMTAQHHHGTPPHSHAGTPQNHPAPSPVHQHPQHPPSSGTPQPTIMYSTNPQQPPLQPSPHTPASPQTVHPPHLQGSFQSFAYTYPTPTMSQTMTHHQQAMQGPTHQQAQYMLMPQTQPPGQGQQIMPHFHHHPLHPGANAMPGQSPMVTSSSVNMHPQIHYMQQHQHQHQHQMQGPPQMAQNYPTQPHGQ